MKLHLFEQSKELCFLYNVKKSKMSCLNSYRKFRDEFLKIMPNYKRFLPHFSIDALGNGSPFPVSSIFQDHRVGIISAFEMAKENEKSRFVLFCAPIVCNPFNITS